MYDEDYSDLFSNGLASSYAKPVGDEPSFLDRFIGSVGTGENGEGGSGLLGGLSNKNLMSGVKGLGNLGLGLASYFQMKPMYEQQLKSMKLANKDMEQSMARQQATRTGLADAIAKSYG